MLKLKTSIEIERDFYHFLQDSALKDVITGDIYRFEEKPSDSSKENLFIKFLAGQDSLLQTGYIAIRVHIPDIIDDYGRNILNEVRIEKVMRALRRFRDEFPCTDGYQLLTGDTDTVEQEEGIYEHYVYARIPFARRAS